MWAAPPRVPPDPARQALGLCGLEVADGRAWEEACPRQAVEALGQVEVAGEVGNHRLDPELRQVRLEGLGLGLQERTGDIDRHVGGQRIEMLEETAQLHGRA